MTILENALRELFKKEVVMLMRSGRTPEDLLINYGFTGMFTGLDKFMDEDTLIEILYDLKDEGE